MVIAILALPSDNVTYMLCIHAASLAVTRVIDVVFLAYNIPARYMASPRRVYIFTNSWLLAIFIFPSDNVTYMFQSVIK